MSIKLLGVAVVAAALIIPSAAMAQSNFDRLMMIDANRDGSITRAEMEQGRTALFNRADTNHDNSISEAERDAVRGRLRTSSTTSSLDGDGDGAITRDELMAHPYPIFDRFDADHNNTLDPSELATLRANASELMDNQ